ncbi:MAG: STAS domain-containing protein [Thermodesulfobacteriota bacterium]|nr:STAS domain-containing protein [Thermodesulfobacteriota bacterium]
MRTSACSFHYKTTIFWMLKTRMPSQGRTRIAIPSVDAECDEMGQSNITKDDAGITVKPQTNLVASMADEFRAELQALVREKPGQIIIDMNGVEMVDSVGIGVMIAVHNSLSKSEGILKIINADKNIYNLFKTMRLDRHFAVEQAP